MNIKYTEINKTYDNYIKLDSSKNNILILGKGTTKKERNNIINPVTPENALKIYGAQSDLYDAYANAYEITNTSNIYTVNCFTTSDFFDIVGTIIQYDFTYIVPIGINISDLFYNSDTGKQEYYCSYILELLNKVDSLSTLIMTDKHISLYENENVFLYEQKNIEKQFVNSSNNTIDNYGNNLIFSLNMINNINNSNVILAALLSLNDSSKYLDSLDSISYNISLDIDANDLNNNNFVYYKYNYILKNISAENLKNYRRKNDIYKNVLIDLLIKKIIKAINLDDFKGRIYNRYTKTQIKSRISKIMSYYNGKIFRSYTLKNIQFVKLNVNSGYIYIELSIVPYGTLEKINIAMEV